MKNKFLIFVIVLSLSLAGCSSGVSQEQFESVVAERDEYKAELESISAALDELSNIFDETEEAETEGSGESTNESNGSSPQLSPAELTEKIVVNNEYSYTNSIGDTLYFLELNNTSDIVAYVESNVICKGADGNAKGAASGECYAIAPGSTTVLVNYFDGVDGEGSFEYTLSAKIDPYYDSVTQDLSYDVSDTGKGLVVTCTNTGTEPAEYVEGIVLFFSGDECIDYETMYFTDSDSELKPGDTLAKQFDFYNDTPYDNYKIYFTGRR